MYELGPGDLVTHNSKSLSSWGFFAAYHCRTGCSRPIRVDLNSGGSAGPELNCDQHGLEALAQALHFVNRPALPVASFDGRYIHATAWPITDFELILKGDEVGECKGPRHKGGTGPTREMWLDGGRLLCPFCHSEAQTT